MVIIFELTDGIDYIMPSTICILVAKWVSDAFGRCGPSDTVSGLFKLSGCVLFQVVSARFSSW